jgi:hypothetical protein
MGACSSQQPLEERCRNKTMHNNAARRTLPQQNNVGTTLLEERCRNKTTWKQENSNRHAIAILSIDIAILQIKLPGEREKRRKDRSTVKANDFTSTGVE